MVIYLAGPIFTEAERYWTKMLKEEIISVLSSNNFEVDVVWPFEIIKAQLNERRSSSITEEELVLKVCTEGLSKADTLVAIIDGCQVDDGTAWEIGYFFNKNKSADVIIGLRTDFRKSGDTQNSTVNSLIHQSLKVIVKSKQDLFNELIKLVATASKINA